MSFAGDVKNELCELKFHCPHCAGAQLYGMLLFSRTVRGDFVLQTEHAAVAASYEELLLKECGVSSSLQERSPQDFQEAVFRRFPEMNGAPAQIFDELRDTCCRCAFVRGTFLVSGMVTNPEKEYHLEIVVSDANLCTAYRIFLSENVGIQMKSITRKNLSVLYQKDSEDIEDFLTLMGATKASLAIMNIKIVKDVRNKANRVTNCDTANIAKSVEASIRQMEDIQLIAETRGLDTLPEALQFAAQLRIKNPDASLRELCESTEPVISRSGMNHRFKKIHEVAEQIRKMQ